MEKNQRNLAVEYEELKTKFLLMKHERSCQQEIIGRNEIQLTKLRSQLENQAQFCSKSGSTLSHILWKVTQDPDIAKTILLEGKMSDLLHVMTSVLTSFNATYQARIPTADTEEARFVQGIIGLVANLSKVDLARQCFLQNDVGKTVIRLLVSIVPRIPSPSGNQLKKLSYVALYNVSIYSNGPSAFMINEQLVKVLNSDIKDFNNTNTEPDLRLFALKLLNSLIRNICSKTTYIIIRDNVELPPLITLASAIDVETEMVARNILDDLRKANKQFDTEIVTI